MRPWTLSALVLLGACGRPATQIVLRVDSDLRAGESLRAVQVTTRREGATADGVRREIDLTGGANPLPGTLSLVPTDLEDLRRLEVTVEAQLVAGDAFATRAIVSFQRERTLVLDIFLASRCRDPANRAGCGPDETCGPDGCEPVRRPTLPTYAPDAAAEVPDAAIDVVRTTPDAPDVGMPDVGMPDVGMPDAGMPDAGTPDAGTPDAGMPCGGQGQVCCAGGVCDALRTSCARSGCNGAGRCAMLPLGDGTACGAVRYGAWGSCGYASVCDRAAEQSRSVTTPQCRAGGCVDVVTAQTQACARDTNGVSCASTGYGAWGACGGYANTCDTTGTRSRTVTTYRCASGSCAGAASTGTEACTRTVTTTTCSWSFGGQTCPGRCAADVCEPACGRAGCPC
ncbi:MAG: hypothetical protein U0325_11820 [Polyangiales bacterium]